NIKPRGSRQQPRRSWSGDAQRTCRKGCGLKRGFGGATPEGKPSPLAFLETAGVWGCNPRGKNLFSPFLMKAEAIWPLYTVISNAVSCIGIIEDCDSQASKPRRQSSRDCIDFQI